MSVATYREEGRWREMLIVQRKAVGEKPLCTGRMAVGDNALCSTALLKIIWVHPDIQIIHLDSSFVWFNTGGIYQGEGKIPMEKLLHNVRVLPNSQLSANAKCLVPI